MPSFSIGSKAALQAQRARCPLAPQPGWLCYPAECSESFREKVWALTKQRPPIACWRDTLRRVPNFRRDAPSIEVGAGLAPLLDLSKEINEQDAR